VGVLGLFVILVASTITVNLAFAITEDTKLTTSDAAAGDNFGFSVYVDGNRTIVGASSSDDQAGSAYIFDFDGTVWTETKLTASDAAAIDFFGRSVSIDGDRAIVGAHGNDDGGSFSGSAYIFELGDSGNAACAGLENAEQSGQGNKEGLAIAIENNEC